MGQRQDRVLTAAVKRLTTNHAIACLILGGVFFGLVFLHGKRLVFSNDEGIILDAAARMLHGQILYRDFFGYMSPGSYWLQELAFRLLGVTQLAGRVPVILDFAIQCALLFWLTARFAGKTAGLTAAGLFLAFQVSSPEYLLAQHRMDSAALSLGSISLCIAGRDRRRSWHWIAAGVLLAAAAACTPSIGLLALVTLGWLLAGRQDRRFLLPYLSGWSAALLAIAIALAADGSLASFVNQMAWLRRNYSNVNVMPYGALIGGYHAALGDGHGIAFALRAFAVFCMALPAVLPVVAVVVWVVWMFRYREERSWAVANGIPYLLACTVAYAASTYPRPDVAHLAFVAVLPAVLTAVWVARHLSEYLRISVVAMMAVFAGLFLAQFAGHVASEVATVATPIGSLHALPADAAALHAFLASVQPRDSLYVHPYNPMLYCLSQSTNPTRFSYLAPGMMTSQEESAAMQSLESLPPRWVLYLPLSRAEFLRVFPHAASLDHRFARIEEWIASNYVPVKPAIVVDGYRLYERAEKGALAANR